MITAIAAIIARGDRGVAQGDYIDYATDAFIAAKEFAREFVGNASGPWTA